MKLSYVILADAAESTTNGKFSLLGGGIETIFAPAFPTVHPGLAMVAKLLATPAEVEREHVCHIEITGPNDYHAPLGDIPFTVVSLHGASESAVINLIINMQVLLFPEPGAYTLHFSVDEQEVGAASLTAQQIDSSETGSSPDQQKKR